MAQEQQNQQPNIVVVMADDLGACDLGAYGNRDAHTPHIDALASEGVRHEAFYVAPVCAPTRAAFLTGRHHLRTGVYGVHGGQDFLDPHEQTIADVLKTAGYVTGLYGKWHSGYGSRYEPWDRGFDDVCKLRLYKHRDPLRGWCAVMTPRARFTNRIFLGSGAIRFSWSRRLIL